MHVPRKRTCVTYVRACTLGNYVQTHVHDYPRVDNTRGNGSSRSVLAMKYDRSFVCIEPEERWIATNRKASRWTRPDRRAERATISTRVASFRGRAVFSNVFFIATNVMCVRFILYHFFTIYRTRRTKRLLYFRHFYDRDPPSESCNFRGIVAARNPVRVRVRGSTGSNFLARTTT